jgi:DNA-directed RNA polymerase specialized sigma24 family protein
VWRFTIVLRFYEDLSERETATLLRCSPAAVKSLVARAMDMLRGRIESEPR